MEKVASIYYIVKASAVGQLCLWTSSCKLQLVTTQRNRCWCDVVSIGIAASTAVPSQHAQHCLSSAITGLPIPYRKRRARDNVYSVAKLPNYLIVILLRENQIPLSNVHCPITSTHWSHAFPPAINRHVWIIQYPGRPKLEQNNCSWFRLHQRCWWTED